MCYRISHRRRRHPAILLLAHLRIRIVSCADIAPLSKNTKSDEVGLLSDNRDRLVPIDRPVSDRFDRYLLT